MRRVALAVVCSLFLRPDARAEGDAPRAIFGTPLVTFAQEEKWEFDREPVPPMYELRDLATVLANAPDDPPPSLRETATRSTEAKTGVKVPIEKGFNGGFPPRPMSAASSPCPPPHRNTGFIDLNYYWDTREFTVFTINAGAKLPEKFEYFQFLNAFSPFDSNSADWRAFYTEVNLRRPIGSDNPWLKSLDWTLQYADGTFADGVARFGVRVRLHDTPGPVGRFFRDVLKLRMGVSFHALESDGDGWQMEYAYRRDFFDKRVYIGGFVDHNINNGGRNSTWVTEHQVGLRLFDQWHAVAEYRYSSFDPRAFNSGFGVGVEYVVRFR